MWNWTGGAAAARLDNDQSLAHITRQQPYISNIDTPVTFTLTSVIIIIRQQPCVSNIDTSVIFILTSVVYS